MAEAPMEESESWCTVESDPGVFQAVCDQMGVTGIQFEEIFTLGPEAFLDLGSKVYGLIFLFKWRAEQRADADVQDPTSSGLFFAQQVIPNACATQAILSILLNSDAEIGPHLKAFKEFTADLDTQMRGLALSNSEVIREAHNSFRLVTDIVPEKDKDSKKDDAFHFVGYIQHGGKIYELDGLKRGPIALADGGEGTEWLEVVRGEIQKRIDSYVATGEGEGGEAEKKAELRFNLMAIVPDKLAAATKELERQRFLRQRTNICLVSLGDEVELEEELDDDEAPSDIPTFEELSERPVPELRDMVKTCNGELHRLRAIVAEQKERREKWKKENEQRRQAQAQQAQMQHMQEAQLQQMLMAQAQAQGGATAASTTPAGATAAPAATPATAPAPAPANAMPVPAAPAAGGPADGTVLLEMKCGRATLQDKKVVPDTRKGLIVLRRTDDGLMNFSWRDRSSGVAEEDLIIFEGDATMQHVKQCKDGFTMLLEFAGRKMFFWSQEPRKKGLKWDAPDGMAKELELMQKINDIMNSPAP